MLTSSAFNLTLGSAWNAYPVTFKDITYSKTKLGGEAGLPWNEPGRLRFEIDDPTIFEIKTVVGSYGDRGLGSNGEVYDNELYYLIPLKEGTTTFRVTLTDETGTFYGQTPEMIVHVNSKAEASIEKLAAKLTNINSLPARRSTTRITSGRVRRGHPSPLRSTATMPRSMFGITWAAAKRRSILSVPTAR